MPTKCKRGDDDGDGDDDDDLEPTVKNAARRVGFRDAAIPAQLYTLWRGRT